MRQPQSLLDGSSFGGAGQLCLQTLIGPDGSDRTVICFPDGVGILTDDLPLAFASQHLNNGQARTIEEAMAMVPGLHRYEAIADLGLAAMATNVPPALDLAKLTEGIYHRHPNYFFLNGSGAYENVTPPIIKHLLEHGSMTPGSTATGT